MEVDQGTAFGTWDDATSRLLYDDIMPVALNGLDTSGYVVDLGGGNGLLRKWLPGATTVDVDRSKCPDVALDITDSEALSRWLGAVKPNLVVLRYVLHYLPLEHVEALMHVLAPYRVLVIQFANNRLVDKYANSVNEDKWFRTVENTSELVCSHHELAECKRLEYVVRAEFYRNRLGHPNPTDHSESLMIYHLNPRSKEQ